MHSLYRAALYLRLSRDDDGVGKSESIKTQQLLLERYCQEQNLPIHDYYIDDGYSGLTYDRPAFQRMLLDIEAGHVNLVLTKDLSRLGRDYIQTGHYTERFFPRLGVRYIAVSDGIDTLYENNDIAPFKNILNDMYAKDLSRKVKSAKRVRAAQGAFIGSHAPYGYRQKRENHNTLEVNEETAPVVQHIFQLALEGTGATDIAKLLQAKGVLTPAAYKVHQGNQHFSHLFKDSGAEKRVCWSCSTVRRILKDQVYLGHMVNHKSQVDHYKTKCRSLIPPAEQIVVEHTHPQLVSQENFDKVQLLIRSRSRTTHSKGSNLFQGLLYCEECGHPLSLATRVHKDRKSVFYRCMHHYRYPEECTGSHYIRFDDIYSLILEEIRQIAASQKQQNHDLMVSLIDLDSQFRTRETHQKSTLSLRLEAIDSIVGQLYEDLGAGRVSSHNHNRLMAKYQQEQAAILERLDSLSSDERLSREAREAQLKQAVEDFLDIRELTHSLLHALIQKIHVGQRERVGKTWTQDLRIEYRFAGEGLTIHAPNRESRE